MNDQELGTISQGELELVRLAMALGATTTAGPLSAREVWIASQAAALDAPADLVVEEARQAVLGGADPLGERLYRLRPAIRRREAGAVYTPGSLVEPMIRWVLQQQPERVVDAGCGSGRYAMSAARQKPDLTIVAVDVDPVATLVCRSALGILGARRATVVNESFIGLGLDPIDGRTAFVGNPPYVRHHRISLAEKEWLIKTAEGFGQRDVSTLAGLHAYFFFAARVLGTPGDVGCFLTASEWLDVGYGRAVRSILLDGLGATAIDVVHPETKAFNAVDSTALITCFELDSSRSSIRLRQVKDVKKLQTLATGRQVSIKRFSAERRWTRLLGRKEDPVPEGYVRLPLRNLFRLRRGIATGANAYFVKTPAEAAEEGLMPWCRPVITRATEILEAGGAISNTPDRKLLLVIPPGLKRREFPALHSYICKGEHDHGALVRIKARYLCGQREPWYAVEWPKPTAVVSTYMARQAPAFALNPDGLGLLNIGHYLQPRRDDLDIPSVVAELNNQGARLVGWGRTYQGGLEKFEPSEMLNLEIDLPAGLLTPGDIAPEGSLKN